MLREALLCACLRAGGAHAGLRVRATSLHIGVPRSLRGSVPRDVQVRACVPRGSRVYLRACMPMPACTAAARMLGLVAPVRVLACRGRACGPACVRASERGGVCARACVRASVLVSVGLSSSTLSLSLCGTAQASSRAHVSTHRSHVPPVHIPYIQTRAQMRTCAHMHTRIRKATRIYRLATLAISHTHASHTHERTHTSFHTHAHTHRKHTHAHDTHAQPRSCIHTHIHTHTHTHLHVHTSQRYTRTHAGGAGQ
jgi:hypothetical protein